MQQDGAIHYGRRGVGGAGGLPNAYKTVSHNTMLIKFIKEKKRMYSSRNVQSKQICLTLS